MIINFGYTNLLTLYLCIYKEQKWHSVDENLRHITSFFSPVKEQMKKLVELLTKEKGKSGMNEWENDDSDKHRALYSGYKKISAIFFYTC